MEELSPCDAGNLDKVQIVKPDGDVNGYLDAYRQYLRNGAPGRHPQSHDYGVMLHELINEISEIDGEFRKQHGRTSWRFYDPAFYEPMMAIRRAAFAAGEDPDAAVAAHPELCSK